MTEQVIELSVEECEAVAGGSGYLGAGSRTEDRSGYIGAGG